MTSKTIKICIISLLLLLSGCTGIKNIQDLTYVVTIGMDYNPENDEYTVYLQGLNFINVAKQETRPAETVPTLVGTATGKTMNLAVSKLYRLSRPPLFFGHTKALVLSKNVMEYKFKEVLEEVGRNRSLRPNLLLFTTDQNIKELLHTKGLFSYPPVYTVLLTEEHIETSQDDIGPVSLMSFLRKYHEPMGSAAIPILTINHEAWETDSPDPVLLLNGYSLFQSSSYRGSLPSKEAIWVDWLLHKRNQINYGLYMEDELTATFKLSSQKLKVEYSKDSTKPAFTLNVNVEAELLEKLEEIPYQKVKGSLEDSIKKEIQSVYDIGIEKKVDLLNVGEKYYRFKAGQYKGLKDRKSFYLSKDSLEKINVKVNLTHYNAYRFDKVKD
ncbi:Ger(x)C family spore germination protein [Rossellomorea oryzaecorticis]|uniref:Ger(X)C family spore germination protein n=1 Tax=Rossellomorea oryzaecorticis TaxID=1396505 RepID=A0ABU9KDG6_9BACI